MTTNPVEHPIVTKARNDFRHGLRDVPERPDHRDMYLAAWNALRDKHAGVSAAS